MTDEGVGPRDVSALKLPTLGYVERDETGLWRMTGADGEPVKAVQWFLADLAATDAADSTLRSYAYDLLRWFRFLSAIDVEWRQATRRDVRDFVRWFRDAPNAQRVRGGQPSSRPAAGTSNHQTGKAYLSPDMRLGPSTMHFLLCRRSIRTPSKPDWARFVTRFRKPNRVRPTRCIRPACDGELHCARRSLAASRATYPTAS